MTLALIAALPAELRPLTRGWQRRDTSQGPIFLGHIGDLDAVAACAGMGAAAVTRACERVLALENRAAGNIDTLVSIGFAGSLSCGLRPPDAASVREVIDAATGERFPTDHPTGDLPAHRLITLDHVAGPREKSSLALQYQAVLVDMEAATVARLARARSLRFLCVKAVTDAPSDKLPDFSPFITADGQLRIPSLLVWALVHPQSWSPLRRLARNSARAAAELANFLPRCLAPPR
jgi:adenosylhomocysteine nucleosidase